MCDYSKREQAMVIIRPGVHCDPCLVPLVRALYENGFPTVASCCGHGKQPASVALADGREVFVADPGWAEVIWDAISAAKAARMAAGCGDTEGGEAERTPPCIHCGYTQPDPGPCRKCNPTWKPWWCPGCGYSPEGCRCPEPADLTLELAQAVLAYDAPRARALAQTLIEARPDTETRNP